MNARITFNMAVAIRRLLLTAPKNTSAARFARQVVAEADRELVGVVKR